MEEQANNRRNNVLLTYRGEAKTPSQWAEQYRVQASCIRDRVNRGWSVEDALTKPVRKINKKAVPA